MTTATITDLDPDNLPLRIPCVFCGHDRGRVVERSGQFVLHLFRAWARRD